MYLQFGQGLLGGDSLSLLTCGVRWVTEIVGVAGILWRLAHSYVWWLLLAVGRDHSLGCQPEHLHMTSPFGCLASSQHGGWFQREREQGKVAWHIWLSFGNHIVLLCSLLLVVVVIKVHPGSEERVNIDPTTWRDKYQHHVIRRVYGMESAVVAIFRKYNLPQFVLLLR